ncbi:MAG: glycosyltransferase family 2 protein [Cytophagales bacterium]|nr:glycosyltransferase [Bernardetiaceae bacterium]MDW8211830.1 glycosyltransferase family 2 protein [Cytophagales bacterium]
MPEVSVIIAAYQAESYLEQAIKSILCQSFTDWELIIVDDASTDKTAAIAAQWAECDKRIKLLRNAQNLGPAASRNRAVAQAQSPLLAFLDADDIAYPQKLARQVEFMRSHPKVGAVAHWIDIVDVHGNPHAEQWEWRREKDSHLPVFLLFHNVFALSAVMMRKSIWEQTEGFPLDLPPCEDFALWIAVAKISQLHILPEKLGARREVPESLSNQKALAQQQHLRILSNQLKQLGIIPSQKQMELHQQLRHRQFIPTDEFAAQARQWLEWLLKQNNSYRIYPKQPFTEVLGEIWYDYWHLRHKEGISILPRYFASPLWRGNNLQKNLLLIALAFKRWIMP